MMIAKIKYIRINKSTEEKNIPIPRGSCSWAALRVRYPSCIQTFEFTITTCSALIRPIQQTAVHSTPANDARVVFLILAFLVFPYIQKMITMIQTAHAGAIAAVAEVSSQKIFDSRLLSVCRALVQDSSSVA